MKFTVSEQNEVKVMGLISDIIFSAKEFKNFKADHTQKIIEHRNEIVAKLLLFKNRSYPIYGALVTDTIYAALVYFIDEIVYERLGFKKWHFLQAELLNCNDGGKHFFELCKQVIDNPSAPLILYKGLYMILANQFRGIYFDDVNQRNILKQKLHYHIEHNDIWINSPLSIGTDPVLHFNKSQWYNRLNNRYFTTVTGCIFGTAVLIYITIYFLL